MSQQWLYNLLTLLVIIFGFFIMLKLQRPAKRPEKKNEYVMPTTVQAKQDMPAIAVQSSADDAAVQDEDLLAVITAAIYAFSGSAAFKVISIKCSCNNWQFVGRQNLMNSRM